MQLDQVLARDELVRVANVEVHLLVLLRPAQVFLVEVWRHFTPNFDALDVGEEAAHGKLSPVGLVEFRPDQVVQLRDTFVFSDESRREAQFAPRLDLRCHFPELVCRDHLDFVEDEKAPGDLADDLHLGLNFATTVLRVAYHEVCADDDASLVFAEHVHCFFGSEGDDRIVLHVGPLVELLAPLLDGDVRVAENEDAFLDTGSRCDAGQSLACAAGENNDAGPCTSIAEHFRKTLHLVVADLRRRLELDI